MEKDKINLNILIEKRRLSTFVRYKSTSLRGISIRTSPVCEVTKRKVTKKEEGNND